MKRAEVLSPLRRQLSPMVTWTPQRWMPTSPAACSPLSSDRVGPSARLLSCRPSSSPDVRTNMTSGRGVDPKRSTRTLTAATSDFSVCRGPRRPDAGRASSGPERGPAAPWPHRARRRADDEAMHSFEEAALSRHVGSGLARAAGWLAEALRQDIRGDRRALLHACRRGFDAVDEHRALLGDLEPASAGDAARHRACRPCGS